MSALSPAQQGVGRASLAEPGASAARLVVLITADDSLTKIVASVIEPPWLLERHLYDQELCRLLQLRNVLVIVDDAMVRECDRGWLLGRLRRHLPDATLLYIAAIYSGENERRARKNGAGYYIAKPLRQDQLAAVLRAFIKVGNSG